MMQTQPLRLAIVVSHPIQYCVPLYRSLAKRDDLELKIFFTWHDAAGPEREVTNTNWCQTGRVIRVHTIFGGCKTLNWCVA
jgi:hypothetical protein